ncbi:sensor histidine kinase [bacterium]|nr:sensor histidine kinase [bacterium]
MQRTLNERIKELSVLHKTARLMIQDDLSECEVIREVVALLPSGWQYPDVTQARICVADIDERTPGFRQADWRQSAEFLVSSEQRGTIDVVYLEQKPDESEGPFLAEERELIDSVADMICSFMRHKSTEREQVEDYQARLRRLATELSLAEARERREIASDLHGQIIQEFAFMKMRLQQLRGDAVFSGFDRQLEEMLTLLEIAIKHTRQLTFEISPPILYELGLIPAIEWLAENYQHRHRIEIRVESKRKKFELSEALKITLFKCVQELLSNVVKHAQAGRVSISCTQNQNCTAITVSDNGCGFDPQVSSANSGSGFGLFSIRERLRCFGGDMQIRSALGSGTTITLSVPVERP